MTAFSKRFGAIDRNGYLLAHKKIYSQPQRPGDVAWNAANCHNVESATIPRALPPAAPHGPI